MCEDGDRRGRRHPPFDFRASTPATSPPGRGVEHRGGDGEEQRRIWVLGLKSTTEKATSKDG